MGTFNGARYLREQLNSLASQSLLPVELHVGDDGSTDETLNILDAFSKSAPFPVHVHVNAGNLGFGENFMQTALRCSGDWIAFCDQDDVWLPTKLETCVAGIVAGPDDVGMVVHNATVTDSSLNPVRPMFDYPARRLCRRMELEPDWHCVGFTQIVRARLLKEIPVKPRPTVPWHPWPEPHDVWTAVIANATGSILFIGAPLVLYRRHESTVTGFAEGNTLGRRLAAMFANNASSYRARAAYLRAIASALRTNAAAAPAGLGALMEDAASQAERFAETNAHRGTLYEVQDIRRSFAAFRRLVGHRAYGGGGNWPLGAKALLKDGLAVLAAPFWRSR